jgi:hypothetical protein
MSEQAINGRQIMLLNMANKRYVARGNSKAELTAINTKGPMGLTCNGKYIYSVDESSGKLTSAEVEGGASVDSPDNYKVFLDRIAADRQAMQISKE